MAKKKIQIKKEHLEKILNDFYDVTYSEEQKKRDMEEDVDDAVKALLKPIYSNAVVAKKTGNKFIDGQIPSYHGDAGNGKPDVMIYDFFENEEISIIIENKNFSSTEDATLQAVTYAGVGKKIGKPVRVVIGNSPSKKPQVKVLVKNTYQPLIINGKEVCSFIGKNLLTLIYDNPNINEFVLEELVEKKFTQKEFHIIINKLKNLYRQIPEIQNNDDLSINFTVSFIALKMIMEKQSVDWKIILTPDNIKEQVDKIIGKKANKELKEKYQDIFIIEDKDGNETFNFYHIVDNVDVRENSEGVRPSESVLMIVHKMLSEIPQKDLEIDLFGEVYECLASKKTKSSLGEYFTRRHIIHAIVRMFLTEDDIQGIVEYKKTIGDPACGTGGFLTESFKYIKEYCSKEKPELDITNLANDIIIGYDINANSIGRTRINMTLAGDGFSDIQRVNTLTSNETKKDIDYILTNVPYGKGDYAISDANSSDEFLKANNNKRLEINFVIKTIQMLKKGGKASIIVPEGLLEAPTLAAFRAYLLKQCRLTTVISLPKYAFAPYTKWKTYVIFVEKRQKPLQSVDDIISKNEKVWAYIVDNDGYANSDKRFVTSLKDTNGAWLHDELQEYIDVNGVRQSSKIEEAYEAELEDEKKSYFNEWNKEIKGKKCGFISIGEIAKAKTVKYKSLTSANVNAILKAEAENNVILSQESYDCLISNIFKNAKGYSVKKAHYIENNVLKEEFITIFDELQIQYDAENNKYYNLKEQEIIYALPLIPEKYFRKKERKKISLKEFAKSVDELDRRIREQFGGRYNEGK